MRNPSIRRDLHVSTRAYGPWLVVASCQTPQTSPETRQAILDYQLTLQRANQLMPAMDAMTKYAVSLPDFQDRVRKSMKMTPAEQLIELPQTEQSDGSRLSGWGTHVLYIFESSMTCSSPLCGCPIVSPVRRVHAPGHPSFEKHHDALLSFARFEWASGYSSCANPRAGSAFSGADWQRPKWAPAQAHLPKRRANA